MGSFQVDMSIRLKQMPKSVSIDEGSSTVDDLKCSVMSVSNVETRQVKVLFMSISHEQ